MNPFNCQEFQNYIKAINKKQNTQAARDTYINVLVAAIKNNPEGVVQQQYKNAVKLYNIQSPLEFDFQWLVALECSNGYGARPTEQLRMVRETVYEFTNWSFHTVYYTYPTHYVYPIDNPAREEIYTELVNSGIDLTYTTNDWQYELI